MAASPPTGAVTLVFTDVQGSTRLWERHPDAMRIALALHDRVMRDAIGAAGGYEVKTEGDAFMIAFSDPASAVTCCLAAQAGLLAAAWPDEILRAESAVEEKSPSGALLHRGLRVRMGVHGGEPECRVDPTTGRMDYFGPVVNRAARINSSGHGGQVLLSERVWRAVEPRLAELGAPPPVAADLGEHRLKDLEELERLFQILPAAVEGRRFAPPRTLDVRKTNLIPHPTDFVGREKDLAAVHALFAGGDRLVTLMGPGGTGKTRISMRYAALHLDEFARDGGGVWFCELTEARDIDDICAVVAGALEVPLIAGKSAAEMVAHLGRAMHGRGGVLVILDNFEQVVSHAGETIAAWMKAAPEARFLVASQERLRLPGEKTYEVSPLSLPEAAGSIGASEAVQLFVHRARSVRPDYVLSEADAPAVGEIVKELDGIPLAIELAAARMGVLSPGKLLERLPRRFDLLGGARRDAMPRQSTLRGAIDWSWNLLQPHEQDALAQCSVFAGGFSLEAAEEVVDLSSHDGAPWPMDVIQSLCDKSLLRAWEPKDFAGELRFGMYSNIREYAAEKLKAGPNAATAAAERHAAWYLREGKAWKDGVDRHDGLQKLRRLAVELENLIAVFQRAVAAKPATKDAAMRALEAIQIVDPLLSTRGPFGTHLALLESAISFARSADVEAITIAPVSLLRGRAQRVRGKTREAIDDIHGALETAVAAKDLALEANARFELGFIQHETGMLAEARASLEAAVSVARQSGERQAQGRSQMYLGALDFAQGKLAEAHRHYDDALAIFREIGNRRLEGAVLGNNGVLLRQEARLDDASAAYLQAIEMYRELGDRRLEGNTLGNVGVLELERGDLPAAAAHFQQAIAIHREVGNVRSEALFLANLGILEFDRNALQAALSYFTRALALLVEVGDRRFEALALGYIGAVRAATGDAAAARAAFEQIESRLTDKDARIREVVGLLHGFVEIREGNPASAVLRLEAAFALPAPSGDIRLAARILRRAVGSG